MRDEDLDGREIVTRMGFYTDFQSCLTVNVPPSHRVWVKEGVDIVDPKGKSCVGKRHRLEPCDDGFSLCHEQT